VADANGFMAKEPFSEVDLIVVDYNLGEIRSVAKRSFAR